MKHEREDRGAVVVTVALFMVVVLGIAALVVDAGALYVAKRKLQNGADAAALAVVADCTRTTCAGYQATAQTAANYNGNGATMSVSVCGGGLSHPAVPACASTPSGVSTASGWVKVSTSTSVSFHFMPGSRTVSASSVVAWGSIGGATGRPLVLSQCVFEAAGGNLDTGAFPSGTVIFFNDSSVGQCTGASGQAKGKKMSEEFGWLTGASSCTLTTSAGQTVAGVASNKINKEFADCGTMLQTSLIVPMFDGLTGSGYHIAGYAQFHVTGYDLLFSNGNPKGSIWGDTTGCKSGAQELCVKGYFEQVVSDGSIGSGEDFGVHTVKFVG